MITEQQFENLWQQAESAEHARRLRKEYPRWRASRRSTAGVAVLLVAVVAAGLPLARPTMVHDDYERVRCNAPLSNGQQWADEAAAMLLEI